MGLFGKKKKKEEVVEPLKLVTKVDEKGIVYYKCPSCSTTLFQQYYLSKEVPKVEECPYCGQKVKV